MAAGLAAMPELTPAAMAHINGLGDRLRAGTQDVAVEQGIHLQTEGLGAPWWDITSPRSLCTTIGTCSRAPGP